MKIFYIGTRKAITLTEDLRTARYIGERLVWDWKKLIEVIKNGRLEISESDIGPTAIDDEYIEFCKIKLNIRSLIYQNCGIDDLIVGWDELNKEFDLVRVLELFVSTSMSRLKDTNTSEIYKIRARCSRFFKNLLLVLQDWKDSYDYP
jgi:hypothetical protein